MRIITWNVNYSNKKIPALIKFALDHDPDILCLQEVPLIILKYLQTLTSYHVTSTYDFHNHRKNKSAFICTLSKIPPNQEKIIQYFHKTEHSILNSIFYQKVMHNHEPHNAILLHITHNQKSYCIINARLSCAIGTRDRLEQLQNILNNLPKDALPILCGDLNIPDSKIFQRMTGWIRGFKKEDYKMNERNAFEELFSKHNLINIFHGFSTWLLDKPLLQLDHILLPEHVPVLYKERCINRFGSDHHMLLSDIEA